MRVWYTGMCSAFPVSFQREKFLFKEKSFFSKRKVESLAVFRPVGLLTVLYSGIFSLGGEVSHAVSVMSHAISGMSHAVSLTSSNSKAAIRRSAVVF